MAIQVIGTFCMDLAMKKAKEVGIGWVTCTGQQRFL
jgi:LDH2 family malate/lactate/ureidoglycolate dehydrogenase